MEAEGIAPSAISAFESTFKSLVSGETGMIPESTIAPVPELVNAADFKDAPDTTLLANTVVLKLNGGLGTGMGLDKAKSLLKVKGDDTFLDLTAKQVIQMRKDYGMKVKVMLMNSFSTSADTMAFLEEKYPSLAGEDGLEMLQNKVPKLDATTYEPATCASNPDNEWCPPGHGDLYAALVGSGCLDSLLKSGYKYMFVSNSDNLGASLDLNILTYFAKSGAPFMMECCERTENDKKGGHLALRGEQLILRESAMCLDEDEAAFQDITKHKFFNTNNLWIQLDKLKEIIDKNGGFIPLPMIMNKKTVDPKDDSSQKVVQLETAMGAAIECFEGATAIVVPRTRFAPVKKCNDLLLLRSDAYLLVDHKPVLNPECGGKAPVISMDSKLYKLVGKLEDATEGGIPSLVKCERLTVKGLVRISKKTKFVGAVSIVNTSDEAKYVPEGEVTGDLDLTGATGLGPLKTTVVKTAPIEGQKPGTSGLRKKTKEFMGEHYLNNFVQAAFDAIKASGTNVSEGSLLIGGDGRYFNDIAIQTIIKMGIANGVKRFWVGQDGLLSTPAVSAIIRERGPVWQKCFGAFILTASHNPGGPEEDFGIKYNCENGGPAPEKVTNAIFANTCTISSYKICNDIPTIDIATAGFTTLKSDDGSMEINVEVISSTGSHINLLKTTFDFPAIKALLDRPDFTMVYDCMHGVNGPYAKKVVIDILGQPAESCMNADPKDDFGGGHADPNLTYAKELVAIMGLDKKGTKIDVGGKKIPSFGAAADGDGDRNMILGSQFFVSPSDSLAVIAAYADVIPFFRSQGGLKGVARSMPTSGAVDLVAKDLNFDLFETPTGWKYFGNLMDSKAIYGGTDYTPFICGEESFGTGSDHVREKDGIWAVLAWLSILASANPDASKPLVTVQDIVEKHWAKYGRNYYSRWDFEGMDKAKATSMMDKMRADTETNTGRTVGKYTIAKADDFTYVDPVDGSVATKQGIRFLMVDGSRVIFRLSGTAGSGATVRMYIEQYEPKDINKVASEALAGLIRVALDLCDIKGFLGTEEPTVIT
ncbi:Phosphoglucomutase-like protein 5 [Seminavis robusta]|uniref:Phosphoglucomutase-like protein 5 n=1 Tax=Seminavis robusta TaxID=568900 RepID=A0A9N8DK97_9STRA|nr:Phosphoglucomutase-like protein 5 [Seminavis robusta]|eukprot:Sro188_g081230.1 Phosphoglucomutase-like protein 5 (1045) ;mRNA; f:57962-61271